MALIDQRWRRQLLAASRFVTWRRTPPWPGFGEPFNGQRERLVTIRSLVADFSPGGFIETGTFLGHTTRFFSGNGIPVYTVEVKPSIYAAARVRLSFDHNIHMMRANSSDAIVQIASQRPFERPFAYLDAHWWEDLPLPKEVSTILATWPEAIIVIDDFFVPGDESYGYDLFRGEPLALEMLDLPEEAVAAFPAQPGSQETGGRRGTVYIAAGADATAALRAQIGAGRLKDARP